MNEIELFICNIADRKYDEFLSRGCAIEGNNGPYLYTDTPVRNTAHWLIIYCFLWKKTKDERYRRIALDFADYLVKMELETVSGAIECMNGEKFDHLNGLIGQAWVIEALIYAANVFNNRAFYEAAKRIYFSQSFIKETCLWKRVEINGTILDYDFTVNHQVWFAIAGCMLNAYEKDAEIESQVNSFMKELLNKHFRIYHNGLIRHYLNIERPNSSISFKSMVKKTIKDSLVMMRKVDPNRYDSKSQEKGYHIFELYGYAILKSFMPKDPLFSSEKFRKALDYGLAIDKLNKVLNIDKIISGKSYCQMNKYAYGYNSPAFELPYIFLIFSHYDDYKKELIDSMFNIQKKLVLNYKSGELDRNNFDSETLTARLYEYIRYFDMIGV